MNKNADYNPLTVKLASNSNFEGKKEGLNGSQERKKERKKAKERAKKMKYCKKKMKGAQGSQSFL